ncbi:MAG: 50S ribosomal protein L31e [Sulfolobales archaeon]
MKEKNEAIYVIPLKRVYWGGSRRNRGKRAVRLIREFIERHFNAKKVLLDESISEFIYSRKIEKPPRRVIVKVFKIDEGVYKATLASEVVKG